jgi:hypothetical protein
VLIKNSHFQSTGPLHNTEWVLMQTIYILYVQDPLIPICFAHEEGRENHWIYYCSVISYHQSGAFLELRQRVFSACIMGGVSAENQAFPGFYGKYVTQHVSPVARVQVFGMVYRVYS